MEPAPPPPSLGWGLYSLLPHPQSSKPEAQSQGLQAQDHSRRKTCPCSWNQVKSGCKLAYQKPKGRVTSTVREAVAVSRVEMVEREMASVKRNERRDRHGGWKGDRPAPQQTCRPAEMGMPRMGRGPRRVVCGLRLECLAHGGDWWLPGSCRGVLARWWGP